MIISLIAEIVMPEYIPAAVLTSPIALFVIRHLIAATQVQNGQIPLIPTRDTVRRAARL